MAECWNVKRPSITSRHERLFSKNRWQIIYLYICTDNIVSGIFFVPICLMTWQYHCYNTLFNTMLDQKCKTNKLTIHYNTLLNTMLGRLALTNITNKLTIRCTLPWSQPHPLFSEIPASNFSDLVYTPDPGGAGILQQIVLCTFHSIWWVVNYFTWER